MPDPMVEIYRRLVRLEARVDQMATLPGYYGWQLDQAMHYVRYAGGQPVWTIDPRTALCEEWTNKTGWTWNSMGSTNHLVTDYGAPYVTLDGSAEYLSIADASWQETGTNTMLAWIWIYFDTTVPTGTAMLVGKYYTATNQRSWRLNYAGGTGLFEFYCTAAGDGTGRQYIESSIGTPVADTWYFVAGLFEPSTKITFWVGASTDAHLTVDSTTTSIPASLYNGSAALTAGGGQGPAYLWLGRLGLGKGIRTIPVTYADGYVRAIFAMTQEFYQED